jgi:hypothetical protein
MLSASSSQYAQPLSHSDVTPSASHEEKDENMLMKIDWEETDNELPKSKKLKAKKVMKK